MIYRRTNRFKKAYSEKNLVQSARLLVSRLERLSADSLWARRSSGIRGSLLKHLEAAEPNAGEKEHLERLIQRGFELLEKAAREICSKRK